MSQLAEILLLLLSLLVSTIFFDYNKLKIS